MKHIRQLYEEKRSIKINNNNSAKNGNFVIDTKEEIKRLAKDIDIAQNIYKITNKATIKAINKNKREI